MSSELEIYRFKTGHYIATNDDYEFIIKTSDFVKWHIFQVIGDTKNELGSAYDLLSEAKKALKTWISEGTHITVVTQDEQPDPAPKAPLPTASIGGVGHATQLDRRPYQFRKSPKMRIYIIDYLQGVIVQHSMNGIIVAFENTKTGAWYDIDFSVETIKNLTYVTMWVNRQHYSTHIMMKWKDCFKLYSRVDADLNEHYASIAVGVGRISSEASYMCSLFRDKLIHEAQAKTDTDVTVLPKPGKGAVIGTCRVKRGELLMVREYEIVREWKPDHYLIKDPVTGGTFSRRADEIAIINISLQAVA